MQAMVGGNIHFTNRNGVRFRGVPIDGGYRLQRRFFLFWCDVTHEQAESEDIGCGLRRVTIRRRPLLVSRCDMEKLLANGIAITSTANRAVDRNRRDEEKVP